MEQREKYPRQLYLIVSPWIKNLSILTFFIVSIRIP